MTVISKQIDEESNVLSSGKFVGAKVSVESDSSKAVPMPVGEVIPSFSRHVSRFRTEVVRSRTTSTAWSLQPSVGSWLTTAPKRMHVTVATTPSVEGPTSPEPTKGTRAFIGIAPPVGDALFALATRPVVANSITPPIGASIELATDFVSPSVRDSTRERQEASNDLGFVRGLELSPNSTSEIEPDLTHSPMQSSLASTIVRQDDDDAMFRSNALEGECSIAPLFGVPSIAPPPGIAPPCGIAPPAAIAPSSGNALRAPSLGIAPPCGIAPPAGL